MTETLSVAASFFALGGDSLKEGQLVAAMRKKLEVQLSVADLFTAPTIGKVQPMPSAIELIRIIFLN